MAAFLLLLLLVLAVVSLALNVRTYKAVKAGGGRAGRSFVIPRKAVVMEPEKNGDIDYESIVAKAMENVSFNTEESGEEEVQLSPEDIQKATKAVMAAMQK